MTKLNYKTKNKKKSYKKTYKKKRGGAPSENITTLIGKLPPVPMRDPSESLLSKLPPVPMRDPILLQKNDECYRATENVKNLTMLLEKEQQLIKEGKRKEALLCKYFNAYIEKLKLHEFYTAIRLETVAPKVPTTL